MSEFVMYPLRNGQKVKLYPKYKLVPTPSGDGGCCGGCVLEESDLGLRNACNKFNSMDVEGDGCFNGESDVGNFVWQRR